MPPHSPLHLRKGEWVIETREEERERERDLHIWIDISRMARLADVGEHLQPSVQGYLDHKKPSSPRTLQ